MAVSVDRFLAVHLHLRYQELVTHKRVVALVISVWTSSAFISLMSLWVPPNIRSLCGGIIIVVGLVLTMAGLHQNLFGRTMQLELQLEQADEMANFANVI